jgi:hypothetical protein
MSKRIEAKKPLRPRSLKCWAIMNIKTRSLTSVYLGGYPKNYVMGDCMDDETAVRVRVHGEKENKDA